MDQCVDYGSVGWHLGVVVKPGLSGLADRVCNLTEDTGIVQRRGVEVPGHADRRTMMICTDVLKERGGLGVQSVSMCSDRRFGIPSSDETDPLSARSGPGAHAAELGRSALQPLAVADQQATPEVVQVLQLTRIMVFPRMRDPAKVATIVGAAQYIVTT